MVSPAQRKAYEAQRQSKPQPCQSITCVLTGYYSAYAFPGLESFHRPQYQQHCEYSDHTGLYHSSRVSSARAIGIFDGAGCP